jgi:hypothetical protein
MEPDVEIIRENRLNPLDARSTRITRNALGSSMLGILHRVGLGFDSIMDVVFPAGTTVDGFALPDMDYATAAFDLGFGDPFDRQSSTSPNGYQAPAKAADGFTRSPEENDVLICPKCGDELCEGDSDIKKQVWAVRACGHVSWQSENA